MEGNGNGYKHTSMDKRFKIFCRNHEVASSAELAHFQGAAPILEGIKFYGS